MRIIVEAPVFSPYRSHTRAPIKRGAAGLLHQWRRLAAIAGGHCRGETDVTGAAPSHVKGG